MTLRELKEWIEKLPEECLEYSIVHAEVSDLPTEDDEDGAEGEPADYAARHGAPLALREHRVHRLLVVMEEAHLRV